MVSQTEWPRSIAFSLPPSALDCSDSSVRVCLMAGWDGGVAAGAGAVAAGRGLGGLMCCLERERASWWEESLLVLEC